MPPLRKLWIIIVLRLNIIIRKEGDRGVQSLYEDKQKEWSNP